MQIRGSWVWQKAHLPMTHTWNVKFVCYLISGDTFEPIQNVLTKICSSPRGVKLWCSRPSCPTKLCWRPWFSALLPPHGNTSQHCLNHFFRHHDNDEVFPPSQSKDQRRHWVFDGWCFEGCNQTTWFTGKFLQSCLEPVNVSKCSSRIPPLLTNHWVGIDRFGTAALCPQMDSLHTMPYLFFTPVWTDPSHCCKLLFETAFLGCCSFQWGFFSAWLYYVWEVT